MKIETAKNRRAQRARTETALKESRTRAQAARKAQRAQEDGFLRMCDVNHREAMEREARAFAAAAAARAPEIKPLTQADPAEDRRDFVSGLANGMITGIVIALAVVWAVALVRGWI